jgi:hypothetical protein
MVEWMSRKEGRTDIKDVRMNIKEGRKERRKDIKDGGMDTKEVKEVEEGY